MTNGLPFRILVVDDDEDDRLWIDEAFIAISYGAEVKKFTKGQMLLEYLGKIDTTLYPSLIVLDNTLPGLDATDLLNVLKNNVLYKDIRVVVYSTVMNPAKKEQLLSAGAYACMEKGATMHDLIKIVRELKQMAESGQQET